MKVLNVLETPVLDEPMKYRGYIAIPIKAPKENVAIKISPLFGEVKFFGFYDKSSKHIDIYRNPVEKGGPVIRMLLHFGIKDLIVLHMGFGAYNLAISNGMNVYFAEDDKKTLDDVVKLYENNELELVTPDKFELLTKYSCHSHDHSHHHHHHP